MSCSKPLDMTWIVDNLNRSFYNGDYKEHRSNLLLDRTMAQMAEAMPEVERRTEIQKQKDAVKAAQEAARVAGNWKINRHLQKLESLLWDVHVMDVAAF